MRVFRCSLLGLQMFAFRQDQHVAFFFRDVLVPLVNLHLGVVIGLGIRWHDGHALPVNQGHDEQDEANGPDRPPVEQIGMADKIDLWS